ncbi:MAG: DNA internalization-related competence protein ComEC/Rec2, partial [Actinomycetes bacterium]|nr:DNA internalization-related competence protein ComEC/Rec2 [Actinomycetes bacterium]
TGAAQGLRLDVFYREGGEELELGERAVVRGAVQAIEAGERSLYRLSRGVVGTLSAAREVEGRSWGSDVLSQLRKYRWRLREIIVASGDGDERVGRREAGWDDEPEEEQAKGLLTGLILGDIRLLRGTKTEDDFRRSGLAHLLSVSGSHLALLSMICFSLCDRLGMRRRMAVVVVLLPALAYVVLTGMAAATQRSFVMLVAQACAMLLNRRGDALQRLALTVGGLLFSEPLLAVSMSFLLSATSVAGIIVFTPYIALWFENLLPHAPSALPNGLALSCVATTTTLPMSSAWFGTIALTSPLSNLVAGPVCAVLLAAGLVFALVGILSPMVAGMWVRVLLRPARLLAAVGAWFARPRWASIPLKEFSVIACGVFIVLGIALWLWWPRPTRRRARVVAAGLGMTVLLVACSAQVPSGSVVSPTGTVGIKEVTVLDVGQGDAMLIRDGSRVALIDTGPSARTLQERLDALGVRHIDVLVLTHDHSDHARGAGALNRSYGIEKFLVAAGAESSEVYADISEKIGLEPQGVQAGYVLKLTNLELRIIAPTAPVTDPSANASCLTTCITDTTPDEVDTVTDDVVLNSGDAEAKVVNAALDALAQKSDGEEPKVDILKVPHHGSKPSLDERLLTRLNLKKAVISCGLNNRYGHPRPECLELLRRFIPGYQRTDVDGNVSFAL